MPDYEKMYHIMRDATMESERMLVESLMLLHEAQSTSVAVLRSNKKMPDYKKSYSIMFNAATDAGLIPGQALRILCDAHIKCKELYLEHENKPDELTATPYSPHKEAAEN